MSFGHNVLIRNAQLDVISTFAGNASLLRAYYGTRPATGGAETTILAEWIMGSPFAVAGASGVLSVTLPADTVGLVAGQVSWFRVVRSDGTTQVTDFGVGDVVINNVNVQVGAAMSVLAFNLTAGNA